MAAHAPRPRRGEPGSRTLYLALAASLLLHLVAGIIAFWIPFEKVRDPRTIEEPQLSVVFMEPQPAPEPPREPLPPLIDPAPRVMQEATTPHEDQSGLPPPPRSLQAPLSASAQPSEEMTSPAAEPELAQADDVRDPPPAEYLEAARRKAEDEAATAAEDRRWTAPPAAAEPRKPRLGLDRALRDFKRDRAAQPPPANPGPPSANFAPDGSSLPTTGFGMGNLVFESADFDWNDYGRQIYWAIWRAWHWRLYQTTNEFDRWAFAQGRWYLDHGVQIRFVIERNGDITGIMMEAGSGCEPLDRSAVDALTEVNLPPLPTAFPREHETIHARFIAIGDIRDMRPSLTYHYQRGEFP